MADCIQGKGKACPTGYYRVSIDGVSYYQHRLAYAGRYGEIPRGYVVHHICHNKSCVNPDHLQAMTRSQHNYAHILPNATATLRSRVTCKYGHENWFLNSDGARTCRTCRRDAGSSYSKRNRDKINAHRRAWRAGKKGY